MARGQKSAGTRSRRKGARSDDTSRPDTEGNQLIGIATTVLGSPMVRKRLLKFLRSNLRRGKGAVVYSEELQPGQKIVITHLTETRADEKRQAQADKKAAKAEEKEAKRAEKAAKKEARRAKAAANAEP